MNQKQSLFQATGKFKLWLLPPLILGVAALAAASLINKKPTLADPVERATKVRTIRITPIKVVPRALGYGKVTPDKAWDAVAQVAGQVEWISDNLKNGQRVAAGTVLLRIQDADYRLSLTQIDAQLRTSGVKDSTTRASLAIAERNYDLLAEDLARKQGLAERGAVSKTTVEESERQVLNARTQVQNLRNTLEINAVERQVLQAQRDRALLDLERTRMIAPFDIRITDVRIGEAQYANKGQLLFTADGIRAAEVEAQFPVGVLRPLIRSVIQNDNSSLDPQQAVTGLDAVVRLYTATHRVEWPARIERTSGIVDPQTQSIGVVVSVADPEGQAQPGQRPRLLRNTFVEVELIAPPMDGQIVVPRAALHGGQLLVVDKENRLEIRNVEVAFTQGNFSVLEGQLEPGERIVTSDLPEPVNGMLLAPREDNKTHRSLVDEASGEELQK